MPCSIYRTIFSIITIASSTTKPTEMVSAISERLSRLYPIRYITPVVITSASGTVTLGMIVAQAVRRNRKITSTTRPTVIAIVNSTSSTEAWIVSERSETRLTWTVGGIDAIRLGIIALIWLTTWIVFAPAARRISSSSVRLSPYQAPVRGYCDELTTSPMSLTWTGAPLRYATMMWRNALASNN